MTWRPEELERCALRAGSFGDPPCHEVVPGCSPCRHCKTPIPRALRPRPAQRQAAGIFTINQEEKAK